MPNGIFPVPEFRPVPARTRPALPSASALAGGATASTKSSPTVPIRPPVTSSAYAPPSSARQRYALSLPTHWSRGWATPAETSR